MAGIRWQKTGLPPTTPEALVFLHKVLRRGSDRLTRGRLRRDRGPVGIANYAEWFRGELRETVERILLDPTSASRPCFAAGALARIVNGHFSGAADHTQLIGKLIAFEVWHRQLVDEPPV